MLIVCVRKPTLFPHRSAVYPCPCIFFSQRTYMAACIVMRIMGPSFSSSPVRGGRLFQRKAAPITVRNRLAICAPWDNPVVDPSIYLSNLRFLLFLIVLGGRAKVLCTPTPSLTHLLSPCLLDRQVDGKGLPVSKGGQQYSSTYAARNKIGGERDWFTG